MVLLPCAPFKLLKVRSSLPASLGVVERYPALGRSGWDALLAIASALVSYQKASRITPLSGKRSGIVMSPLLTWYPAALYISHKSRALPSWCLSTWGNCNQRKVSTAAVAIANGLSG